ncbi:MAG: type II toxin-antitoxin system RelE/ParE family toxin [Rhodospirillaceae bacterium]
MRVYKNKWFHRWARGEGIADATLIAAVEEILAGKVDADLGGYLFKKRLARAGQGKSGGYRTIVGYRKSGSDRLIFLFAFPKNSKANISGREEAALSIAAEGFLNATDEHVNALLEKGAVWEVTTDE